MNLAAEFDLIPLGATGGAAVACWHAYDAASQVELHSTALRAGDRLIFVDPIPLAPDALQQLAAQAAPAAILLTNANHARAAADYRQRFSIPVYAHADAVPELGLAVDVVIPAGGGPVLDRCRALPLPGAVAGEVALYHGGGGGVMILGDAVVDLPGRPCTFLPAKYCLDSRQLRRSLRQLLAESFTTLTLAHGEPITPGAHARLAALLTTEAS